MAEKWRFIMLPEADKVMAVRTHRERGDQTVRIEYFDATTKNTVLVLQMSRDEARRLFVLMREALKVPDCERCFVHIAPEAPKPTN